MEKDQLTDKINIHQIEIRKLNLKSQEEFKEKYPEVPLLKAN